VPRVQLDFEHLLLLGRQVGGHLFLGAPLDQRLDPPPQLGEPLLERGQLDRPLIAMGELAKAQRRTPRPVQGEHFPQQADLGGGVTACHAVAVELAPTRSVLVTKSVIVL